MNKYIYELSRLGINLQNKTLNDNYDSIEKIGSGGHGNIYKIKDKYTEKIYVAKVTNISEIFEIYFYIITQCAHPNLICLHDYFVGKRNKLYLIYDYIPGSYELNKLHYEAYTSQLYIDYLIKVLLDVSSALKYIHSKGILHLDIKSSNILITLPALPTLPTLPASNLSRNNIDVNQIKGYLIDYGFACLKDIKSDSSEYDPYSCVNNFPYRTKYRYYSPELINRSVPIDKITTSSDIYSLGITIHDCMLNPYILNDIYKYQYVFQCEADELNNEYSLFLNKYHISPIQRVENILIASTHKYAKALFNLSIKMTRYDPEERLTIDQIIDTLSRFN